MPPAVDNHASARPAAARRRVRSANLTDMEREILDDNADGFDRVVVELQGIKAKAPHPALVWTIGAAIVVYMVSLIATSRGIDVGAAAEATQIVVSAAMPAPATTVTTTTETTTAPSVEAAPVEE